MISSISKGQEGGKKLKRVLTAIGITAGVFALINLIWFIGIKSRYWGLTQMLDDPEDELNNYTAEINGYRYIVKDTGYLSNSGFANVSIAKDIEIEIDDDGSYNTNGLTKVTLYIWPEWFSGYTYGIDIDNGEDAYQINVDENGNYIAYKNEDQDALKRILDENSEEIDRLFDLADKMWDIR